MQRLWEVPLPVLGSYLPNLSEIACAIHLKINKT